MNKISDAAVRQICIAVYRNYVCGKRDYRAECEREIRAALEAALPHMQQAELAASRAEVEGLKKDAERYRWLRDLPEGHPSEEIGNMPGDMWDDRIDEGMEEQAE